MAKKANESSPLLASRMQQSPHAQTPSRLRKTLYVIIPLAAVALIALGWHFAYEKNNEHHADSASTSSGNPKNSLRQPPKDESEDDEPPKVDAANYSDAELLTLLPPFVGRLHPIPPKQINRHKFATAIPTNEFWTNLLVGDDHGLNIGAGQVTLSPYTIRSLPKRLEISYGDSRRVVMSENITEYFNVDVSLTGYSQQVDKSNDTLLLGDGNSTSREVVAFDSLSVTVQYYFEGETGDNAHHWMKALLMRGSAYVTVEYQDIIPVLELNATLLAVNQETIEESSNLTASEKEWTSSRFELDVEVYGATQGTSQQKWILYFEEERTLQLQFANEKDYRLYNQRGELTTPTNIRLVDTDFYTGAARLAIVPRGDASDDFVAQLDASASVYPISSYIDMKVSDATADVSFCWETKTFKGVDNSKASRDLLMLAHPHHVATFDTEKESNSTFQVLKTFGHRTLKSNMTAVVGDCWKRQETLPDIGFEMTEGSLDPAFVDVISASLANDSNYTPIAQDPYYFGKEIGRQARLVLIADTLNEVDQREELLDNLQQWIAPWLLGHNDNHFVYDEAWGGICSRNGLKGVFWMTDFGNGWYNDHHFHYGYFLYAVAVVAKFRPEFGDTHKAGILAVVRDIASFNADDKYFPLTRHFSWFDGHSFASGVYTLDGGKSQESVSEAINAYYGVYLVGKALQIAEVEEIGHLLLAQEIRAAQTYWQMPSYSDIYEPLYAQNKMTGQVGCTKVSYTTWFGPQVEHIHLINMIPFTPVTSAFLKPSYIREEYPVLQEKALDRTVDPIEKRWEGYAYLDLAIIDPNAAWSKIMIMDFFDDGSSRTNSLFWVATQPGANATILLN